MLSRRVALPRAALVCTALIALALLPEWRTCRSADPPAQPEAKKSRPPRARRPRPPLLPASLVGRITDEKGAPVADAELQIYPKDGGLVSMAKTKADGTYAFDRVASTAVYHLTISSTRCVGLNDYQDDRLNIPLDPPQTVTRDFVLKRGCQLRLTVIDEEGHPIPKVTIYKPGRLDQRFSRTDKAGQVTVGGMPPATLPVRFALRHDDFAIEPLDVKLDDPNAVVERTVTLTPGKSIQGTVTCSDGKPASGCKIVALPSWWEFNSYPNGQAILADGSFVLPHVGPGAYKLSVFVPKGKGMSTVVNLLSDANLLNRKEPLALKADFPSPGSMAFIAGRIRYKGNQRPKRGFWINANSPGAALLGAGQYVQPDENSFKITSLVAGRYTLRIESQEIESKELVGVATGTDNLELEIEVRGTLSLKGLVTGDEGGGPLKDVKIRLFKTRYLRGPNYGVDQQWHPVPDPKGAFSIEIPGSGVYVVEASADGYALGRSEPANSDTDLAKPIHVKLSRGLSISGRVVDEAGRPIDGATVLANSLFGKALPVSVAKVPAGTGVSTKDGRFAFEHLSPGSEMFRALHSDYAFADLKDVELKAGTPTTPLTITLKRGGTVRGRVFDETGRPAAGVSLRFANTESHDFQGTGEFASGISDEAGEFEVAHLPESLVYISRGDEWNTLGVVRQAVLPSAGKTLRVDFGGIKKVTGRLLVNGAPVAKTKVLLSGDQPYWGVFKAYAITDGDGNFVFRGIPSGERWLYYSLGTQRRQEWVRVRPLRVETSNDPFGTIDLVAGTLTVHCPAVDPATPTEVNVSLSHYDPVWFAQGQWIDSAPRQGKNDPFVFQNVPIGKYALGITRRGKLGIREVIDITGRGGKAVTIDWPQGTGSLRGKVPPGQAESRSYLQLRSKDKRLMGGMEVAADGTFQMDGLPAGDYFLTQQYSIDPDPIVTFSLAGGERKTISLTEANLKSQQQPAGGRLIVKPYTSEGLPLPGCQMTLTGSKGESPRQTVQSGQVSFLTAPGPYHLSVSYPGFAPVTKQVDVKTTQNGLWGTELNVMLARPTEEPKPEIH